MPFRNGHVLKYGFTSMESRERERETLNPVSTPSTKLEYKQTVSLTLSFFASLGNLGICFPSLPSSSSSLAPETAPKPDLAAAAAKYLELHGALRKKISCSREKEQSCTREGKKGGFPVFPKLTSKLRKGEGGGGGAMKS